MIEASLIFNFLSAVGSLATAAAVFYARGQLKQADIQNRTNFEDEFPREYRQLCQTIPVKAFFGKPLEGEEREQAKHAFFRYVDLCNEQVFLRQQGRVSEETWASWRGGIKSNLELPAFKQAWEEIERETSSFAELRKLEESSFKADPLSWGRGHVELPPRAPDKPS